jgi:hypothetical protein
VLLPPQQLAAHSMKEKKKMGSTPTNNLADLTPQRDAAAESAEKTEQSSGADEKGRTEPKGKPSPTDVEPNAAPAAVTENQAVHADGQPPTVGKLTAEQQTKLAGFEQTIEKGLGSFVDVGLALKAIQDDKLYETEPEQDFPRYCKTRWRMSKAYAHRLIHAAEFVEKLKKLDGNKAVTVFPINESQVRPIVEKLRGNQWVSTWKEVIKQVGDGAITAAIVAKVVREKLGDPAPRVTGARDRTEQQPNESLQKITDLVKDARSKTKGATIEFYKQTLEQIWGELQPQSKAA